MIVDICLYNGESDLFDLRYKILKSTVDKFIVCEAPTTFSGKPKKLSFQKKNYRRVEYFVIDENYSPDEIALAESSPNTQGASHWKHEFLQKESIKKALTGLNDDDIVFIGDCDEIYEPHTDRVGFVMPRKLRLRVYTYFLNNRSSEEFWGTLVAKYKDIKDECLNHMRSNTEKSTGTYGWHFTSMHHQLKQKLDDSYTEETYNSPWVQENLENNIKNQQDFLGRDFAFWKDEEDWPEYLRENKYTYKHLLL